MLDSVTVLESELLKMIAAALTDFADLNCYAALQLLLEVCKTVVVSSGTLNVAQLNSM